MKSDSTTDLTDMTRLYSDLAITQPIMSNNKIKFEIGSIGSALEKRELQRRIRNFLAHYTAASDIGTDDIKITSSSELNSSKLVSAGKGEQMNIDSINDESLKRSPNISGSANISGKSEQLNDDPITILKKRFAKGEISKEDYQEMLKMLSANP
jgi:hypothetical protein